MSSWSLLEENKVNVAPHVHYLLVVWEQIAMDDTTERGNAPGPIVRGIVLLKLNQTEDKQSQVSGHKKLWASLNATRLILRHVGGVAVASDRSSVLSVFYEVISKWSVAATPPSRHRLLRLAVVEQEGAGSRLTSWRTRCRCCRAVLWGLRLLGLYLRCLWGRGVGGWVGV